MLLDVTLMISVLRAAVVYYFQSYKTFGLPYESEEDLPVSILKCDRDQMTREWDLTPCYILC
jgi:hypothetical protein